ncbi:hypothetical protein [Clostridium sp.]|uniref:hypothetical protein n=1 Tax=Clostridium sp. TaxID=1506 RepID=UPI0039F52CAF
MEVKVIKVDYDHQKVEEFLIAAVILKMKKSMKNRQADYVIGVNFKNTVRRRFLICYYLKMKEERKRLM